MIADVYGHPSPTPAMESALHGALLHLSRAEGYLDSLSRPILTEGFRYERSVMQLTAYVADEGGTAWKDRGPIARALADTLGYTSSANLMAAVREAVSQGLLSASVRGNDGWLMVSEYGWEQLGLWEEDDT